MRAVAADAPDEYLVAPLRLERRGQLVESNTGGAAQELLGLRHGQGLARLEVDGKGVPDADRNPYARRRHAYLLVVEDLARLEHQLALLVGVIVAFGERPRRADDVEGDRFGIDLGGRHVHPVERAVSLPLELVDSALSGPGYRLVGGHHDPLEPDGAVDR